MLDRINRLAWFTALGTALITISFASIRHPVSYDAFWHLRAGLDWLNSGLSPFVDHYSFTFHGTPISSPSVVFDAMLGFSVQTFGLVPGFQFLKAIFWVSLCAALITYYRQLKVPGLAVLATLPILLYFVGQRSTMRPELFSYILVVVLFILYHRTRLNFSNRNLAIMVGLLVLWSNYHQPLFGYMVAAALFVDKGVDKLTGARADFSWRFYFIWSAIIACSGFVNYTGTHFLLAYFNFSPEWKIHIHEFWPAQKVFGHLLTVMGLFPVGVIVVGWLLRRRDFGLAGMTAMVLYATWEHARLIGFAGLVVGLNGAYCMAASLSGEKTSRQQKFAQRSLALVAALIGSVGVVQALILSSEMLTEHQDRAKMFPHEIMPRIKQLADGNIFNEYSLGGYLQYHLAPEHKVYIDGRTNILYPLEFYQRSLEALQSSAVLAEETERYDINYALLKLNRQRYYLMQRGTDLELDFADANFALFTRKDPAFATSGKLMMLPMCWPSAKLQRAQLEAEVERVELLPQDSALRPILRVLERRLSERPHAELVNAAGTSDLAKRLVAYIAMHDGRDLEAVTAFQSIKKLEYADIMLTAMALDRQQHFRDVENSIHFLLYGRWSLTPIQIGPYYRAIIYSLLERVEREAGLVKFDQKFLSSLQEAASTKYSLPILEYEHGYQCD